MAISRAAGLVALFALSGCLSPVKTTAKADSSEAAAYRLLLAGNTVDDWSPMPALSARRLLEEYGAPDEVRPEYLVWRGRGPWARIIVWDIKPPYAQGDDIGFVEQAVEYPPLSAAQAVNLAAFDRRLVYYGLVQELGARSEREELNFLRLNLANEVVNWRLTPQQARERYTDVLNYEAAGKSSPWMERLLFSPR